MARVTDKRTRDIDKIAGNNFFIFLGKVLIIIELPMSIPFFWMLAIAGDTTGEMAGFMPLLLIAYFLMGPGLACIGVFFRIAGHYFKIGTNVRALLHHCPYCNFESSAKQPDFRLCTSCTGLMELSVQCKKCSNWFNTSQLGRMQCPQCKAVIFL